MRVLVHGARPRIKGGGERYFEELARRFAAKAEVTVHYADEPWPDGRFDVVHLASVSPRVLRRARRSARVLAVTFHVSPWQYVTHGWATGRGGAYRLGQAAVYARQLAKGARHLALADVPIAVSDSTAAGLRRNWPPAASRVRVVENGVDPALYRPSGIDGGYGLFVGRLERVKGPDVAVEAFRRLGLPLVVAGTGAMGPALREAARGADVRFVPAPTDAELLALYRDASVAVFPSLSEGYPFVVLEALASGTPVVSARSFECRAPVRDLVRWVPPADPAALADAVRATWGTKTKESAARLHDAIATSRSWDHVIAETLGAYEEALAR